MKKLLLGTSALIGATAMVASAQAAAPELTISGNLDFRIEGGESQSTISFAGGSDVEPSGGGDIAGTTGNRAGDNWRFVNSNSLSEIRFRATGESDGGTTYGAVIDYRYLQTRDTRPTASGGAGPGTNQKTDEAYIFVGGDWGRVHLGQDDGVLDQFVPNAGWVGAGSFMIDGWTTSFAPETHSNSDSNKIVYYSPDLGGFDFGISLSEEIDGFTNAVELAARYSTDFGDGGFTVALGYQLGEHAAGGEDLEEWVIGATVNFGQFSIGLSYDDAQDSGVSATQAMDGLAEGRQFYSIGVGYDIGGGMRVALSYAEGEASYHAAASGTGRYKREQDLFALDFGFPIMEGMSGYAGIARSSASTAEAAVAAADRATTAVTYVLGTTVSF